MLKKYIIIAIVSIFFIFQGASVLAKLDQNAVSWSDYADKLIEDDVGKDIGNDLLEGGFLGEAAFEYDPLNFLYAYSFNNNLHFLDDKHNYKPDEYSKKMHDLYQKIVEDLKDDPNMKFFFDEMDKYSGMRR